MIYSGLIHYLVDIVLGLAPGVPGSTTNSGNTSFFPLLELLFLWGTRLQAESLLIMYPTWGTLSQGLLWPISAYPWHWSGYKWMSEWMNEQTGYPGSSFWYSYRARKAGRSDMWLHWKWQALFPETTSSSRSSKYRDGMYRIWSFNTPTKDQRWGNTHELNRCIILPVRMWVRNVLQAWIVLSRRWDVRLWNDI